MSTIFQKYAAALLPFFVLVIGASQTVLHRPIDWNATITFAILVLGAVITYIVKLLPGKWQGGLKTGVAILTTILSAILPFVLPGGWVTGVNLPIVIVAVLSALATQLGVAIRVADSPVGGAVVPDPEALPKHVAEAA